MSSAPDAAVITAAQSAETADDATKALSAADELGSYEETEQPKAAVDARETAAVEVAVQAEAFAEAGADANLKEAEVVRELAWAAEASVSGVAKTPTETSEADEPEATNVCTPEPSISPEPQSSPSLTEEDHEVNRSGRHRFVHFSCMACRKCRWCWQQIKLLRGASRCQNCGIIVHKMCQRAVSRACGDPEHLWARYNYVKRDLSYNPATPSFETENVTCWVYLHRPDQRQLTYLRFVRKTLNLYSEYPAENTVPEEFYPLGLHEIHTNIATDVSGRFKGDNLDRYISVQFYDCKESGAPRLTVMLEFLTDWDREMFIDAYDAQISR